MTDNTATPAVVKQEPTKATYQRSVAVAGGTVALPFAFAQLFDFMGDVWHGIWPHIPDPSEAQCLAAGVIITGIPTFWASFSIRGTKASDIE